MEFCGFYGWRGMLTSSRKIFALTYVIEIYMTPPWHFVHWFFRCHYIWYAKQMQNPNEQSSLSSPLPHCSHSLAHKIVKYNKLNIVGTWSWPMNNHISKQSWIQPRINCANQQWLEKEIKSINNFPLISSAKWFTKSPEKKIYIPS